MDAVLAFLNTPNAFFDDGCSTEPLIYMWDMRSKSDLGNSCNTARGLYTIDTLA